MRVTMNAPPPRIARGTGAALRASAVLALLALGPALPAPALAAEGGPAANTPVPAGTGGAAPSTVTAQTTTSPPASGGTVAGTATAPTGTTVPTATAPAATTPATPVLPANTSSRPSGLPAHSAHPRQASSGTSTTAIVLGVVGALIVLGCVLWALSRMTSFEPRWTLSLRHSLAEAGHRMSSTWAEFTDWLRLGR
jgi:hypothetical protein